MSHIPDGIQFAWQLVSQFVSWEFCRYMSEQCASSTAETDVLTFLRNMIVQRTEKSVSEVTKHEIIAKFIMEIKAIQNFEISSIVPLSESVKKICPELETAVSKLVHHLETFFNALDSTDESRKELIELRIEDAINDFSKEASRLLPQPNLLQIVDTWNHPHRHTHQKPIRKQVYNTVLFEKVLECLHYESITPAEARLIAVALNEDKVFEKILRNAEAEPETEADSEPFTLSQHSQPNENVYSQEFERNSQVTKLNGIPLNHKPHNPEAHNLVSSPVDIPVQVPDEVPYNIQLQDDSPELIGSVSPPLSPPAYPFMHSVTSKQNKNAELQNNALSLLHNNTTNHMQFAQSSTNESEDNSDLNDHLHTKFQELYENQRAHNPSDSDTSDCDKNPEFRFLTPTYFKRGTSAKSQVIYISDQDSCNSSVITTAPSSQQNDPNWSSRQSFLPATQYEKPTKKKLKPDKKKKAAIVYSSDSDDGPIDLSSSAPFRSPQPSTSARVCSDAESDRPSKKRRIAKKLYRSPNLCIDDFVSLVRKPESVSPTTPPLHKGTNTRSTRKKPAASEKSLKTQKCKQCTKAYRTAIALRRHIFLKHTEPPDDSDCDT